jgi:GMP synthase-like glutamine amidotransferase
MKPVAICRFAPHEGPGYFATYLDSRCVPWCVIKLDCGESLPDVKHITGLAMMGGPMSVNDDLPWLRAVLSLAQQCVANDVPVIGHCLGGQLLAKALGAQVTRNPVKEIGWGRVDLVDRATASEWGSREPFVSYHWHGETFSIPAGTTRIWSSAHCANQAFVLKGHIGMQCHVEMTEELIASWCETGADEIARSIERSPAVQPPEAMRENLSSKLSALHRVADGIYERWLQGVKASSTSAKVRTVNP